MSQDEAAVFALEEIMRSPQDAADLQALLFKSISWAEGEHATPAMVQRIRLSLQQTLRTFFEENVPRTRLQTLLQEVQVRTEEGGSRIVFDLPAELHQWLQPPSMLSF